MVAANGGAMNSCRLRSTLLSYYDKIAPSPLCRETAVYENHLVYPELAEGYSGVRGAPPSVFTGGAAYSISCRNFNHYLSSYRINQFI